MIKLLLKASIVLKLDRKEKKIVLGIKAGDVINDEEILVEMFNNHYINILENSTGVELGTP